MLQADTQRPGLCHLQVGISGKSASTIKLHLKFLSSSSVIILDNFVIRAQHCPERPAYSHGTGFHKACMTEK